MNFDFDVGSALSLVTTITNLEVELVLHCDPSSFVMASKGELNNAVQELRQGQRLEVSVDNIR